jgi:hypothetical protein
MEAPPAEFLVQLARQVQPIVGDRVREMLTETLRSAREQCQGATARARAPMQTGFTGDAVAAEEAWLELENRLRAACRGPAPGVAAPA